MAACPADGSPMKAVPSVPRLIDGRYRLDQLLARGGTGAVYRAKDIRLDRPIAVKVVPAARLGGADAGLRFHRDAQIVSRLRHPSIVAIFDSGTVADGGAYLVMELVRGEDLRRALLREGRMDAARAAGILTSVCSGVEAAHREGVLHRDLKPENILLPGDDGPAKVVDFGVAAAVEERTEAGGGIIVGTPAYMAPEQLRGAVPDARADVFSLGVIAYEMLTGTRPFGRGSLAEVVLAQARGVPPIVAGAVPPGIARAVRAALDPDRDRRPPSPQAFAHLISAGLEM